MSKKMVAKLIALNGLLSLMNIILFSDTFLHLDMSGQNAFATAFGVMEIVMSVLLFFYGNYRILFKKPPFIPEQIIQDREIATLEDCAAAAKQYMKTNEAKTFNDTLNTIIWQTESLKKKKAAIHQNLLDRFSDTEMSYDKFRSAVEGIERIMISNIRSLITRINAFDEGEYEKIIYEYRKKGNTSDSILQSRMNIYNEYIAYSQKVVMNNEQMLIKLDQLMLEISKLDNLSDGDIADMDAMREIESLINDTKWYK